MLYTDGKTGDYTSQPHIKHVGKPNGKWIRKGIFCTKSCVDIIYQNKTPCGDKDGVRSCMDCPFAYIQMLNFKEHLHGAETTLSNMGISPIKKTKPVKNRFIGIIEQDRRQ